MMTFVLTGVPFWKLVAKQFEDLLVIILLVAAVISFVLGLFDDDGSFLDAFLEPTGVLTLIRDSDAPAIFSP